NSADSGGKYETGGLRPKTQKPAKGGLLIIRRGGEISSVVVEFSQNQRNIARGFLPRECFAFVRFRFSAWSLSLVGLSNREDEICLHH
ncbi:MAG: hypothetical protein J0626_00980, partial [Rhodospirillaceae bacterium]|nr:hypothetical protein [Rhodospirillaceae bacterium]